jgi:hypothetical protein
MIGRQNSVGMSERESPTTGWVESANVIEMTREKHPNREMEEMQD